MAWTLQTKSGKNSRPITRLKLVLKIKKHKQQLHTPEKDRSISAYLLDIKKTVDQLAVVGCPISIEDHIEVVLNGLSDEYDSFITSVTSRLDPYTVADIEALLLAQENRIERTKQLVDHILHTNVASVPSFFSHYNSSFTNHPSSFRPLVLLNSLLFYSLKNYIKMIKFLVYNTKNINDFFINK